MRLWDNGDEWVRHASCGDDIRFIKDPDVLSSNDIEEVEDICAACPVRPECMRDVLRHVDVLKSKKGDYVQSVSEGNGVWCAGEWVPDHCSPGSRKAAFEARWRIFVDLPKELAWRPGEIL